MNILSGNNERMEESDPHILGKRAFQKRGMSDKKANDVAPILLLADLLRLSTHGLSRLQSYEDRLKISRINAPEYLN